MKDCWHHEQINDKSPLPSDREGEAYFYANRANLGAQGTYIWNDRLINYKNYKW